MARLFGASLVVAAVAACGIVPMGLAQDTETEAVESSSGIEEVKSKLDELNKDLNSYTADMVMEFAPPGLPDKQQMTGSLAGKKNGEGEMLSRVEMKGEFNMQGMKMEMESLTIYDGEALYNLSSMKMPMAPEPMVSATKDAPDERQKMTPSALFDQLEEENTLVRLDDSQISGEDVFVVEASGNGTAQMGLARQVISFSKKTGMPILTVGFDVDGNEQMKMTLSNVETNIKIDDDQFVFEAPAGVDVVENGGGGSPW